ncbi:MAG: hypothetical protein ACLQNE_39140 [Thermoguttaceae bacterium]
MRKLRLGRSWGFIGRGSVWQEAQEQDGGQHLGKEEGRGGISAPRISENPGCC